MNVHPIREEDFDLYALGALEDDEKDAIESHVSSCSECAKKLAEAQGRMALLAFGVPRVEPSPRVKERLMRQLHATADSPGVGRGAIKPERAGGFFGHRWTAVLVPVVAALALATIVLWSRNMQLDRQIVDLRSSMRQQQKQLDDARTAEDLMSAQDTVVVALAAQRNVPQGSARVLYNARLGVMFYEGKLGPAPAGKSYQLWLVPVSGNPVSAAVFNAESAPSNTFTTKFPQGTTAKAFAVTLEPSGGRAQPTGPFVLVGPVS
jgi:anti-sigma-K factor RskA